MQPTPDQIAQAKIALQSLGDIPLLSAVEHFFTVGPGGRKPMTLGEAIKPHRGSRVKAKSDEDYIDAQEISINLLLATFDDRKKKTKKESKGV